MKKIFYTGLSIFFIALMVAKGLDNTNAQRKWRGESRTHVTPMDVKTVTTAGIGVGTAVMYDTTGIMVFTSNILADNHAITPDSTTFALGKRGGAFAIRLHMVGVAASTDTVIVYGGELPFPFYSVTDTIVNVNVNPDGAKGGGDTLLLNSGDPTFRTEKLYGSIDSVRTMSVSGSGLTAIRVIAVPLLYVVAADSATTHFAGIVTTAITVDSSGVGSAGAADATDSLGSGFGTIAINGFVKAIVSAPPRTNIFSGQDLTVGTNSYLIRALGLTGSPIDSLVVAEAIQFGYSDSLSVADTLWVKLGK